MDNYCCNKFKSHAIKATSTSPSSLVYDSDDPSPQFKKDGGKWNILGCCHNCYVVEGMKYCPFCGAQIHA